MKLSSDEKPVSSLQVSFTLKSRRKRGKSPKENERTIKPGNIPRVSKLMALAIRMEGLVQRGEVRDYADLARLGYVTRARITQIMNLLNLAPDIQEELLFLPRTIKGRDPIFEKDLRPIVTVPFWQRQRNMWAKLAAQRWVRSTR
jgi:hypothetical protein